MNQAPSFSKAPPFNAGNVMVLPCSICGGKIPAHFQSSPAMKAMSMYHTGKDCSYPAKTKWGEEHLVKPATVAATATPTAATASGAVKPADDKKVNVDPELKARLMKYENSIKDGWNRTIPGRWVPHVSRELGLKTIAYGHKCASMDEQTMFEKEGITEERAQEILEADIVERARYAKQVLVNNGVNVDRLKSEALTVVTEMAFQMTNEGFVFPNMFKELAKEKIDYLKVGDHMLDSKWAREDSPKRARELVGRMWALQP